MKSFLVTFFFISSSFSFSQNWCSPGSEWFYGWNNSPVNGYIHLTYTGDTLIGAQTCNKIYKMTYWYNQAFFSSGSNYLGTEYTYADINKVYIYKNSQFFTMYDFGALPGATWIVPATKNYGACQTQATIKTDSIGTMVINSQTLRYICVTYNDTAQHWGWCAKIVEKIGPIKWFYFNGQPTWDYLFPVKNDYCGMFIDELAEGGNFRCYNDSSGFMYSSGISPTCNYLINSISEIDKQSVLFFPNPTNDILNISFDLQNETKIRIVDLTGKIVAETKTENSKGKTIQHINISALSKGIYFVNLQNEGKIYSKKFIKE